MAKLVSRGLSWLKNVATTTWSLVATATILGLAVTLAIWSAFRRGLKTGTAIEEAEGRLEKSKELLEKGDTKGLRDEILKRVD